MIRADVCNGPVRSLVMARRPLSLFVVAAMFVVACATNETAKPAPPATIDRLAGSADGADIFGAAPEDFKFGDITDIDVMNDDSVLIATIGPNQIVRVTDTEVLLFAGGGQTGDVSETDPCGLGDGGQAADAVIGLVSGIDVYDDHVFVTESTNCGGDLRSHVRGITADGVITTVLPGDQVLGDVVAAVGYRHNFLTWSETGDQKVLTNSVLTDGGVADAPGFMPIGDGDAAASRAAYGLGDTVIEHIAVRGDDIFFSTSDPDKTSNPPPAPPGVAKSKFPDAVYAVVRANKDDGSRPVERLDRLFGPAPDDLFWDDSGLIVDLFVDLGRRLWAVDANNDQILFWEDPFIDDAPRTFGGTTRLHSGPSLDDADLGDVRSIAVSGDGGTLFMATDGQLFSVRVPFPSYAPPDKTHSFPGIPPADTSTSTSVPVVADP